MSKKAAIPENRSFIIRRHPLKEKGAVRVRLFSTLFGINQRVAAFKKDEWNPRGDEQVMGYCIHADFIPLKAERRGITVEIGIAAPSLTPGLIAHEALHAALALQPHVDLNDAGAWEESIAETVEYITTAIWNRRSIVSAKRPEPPRRW